MKNILFISHDTSRSGAPTVLLNYIKWMKKKHPQADIGFVALNRGDLIKEFLEVVDYHIELPVHSVLQKLRNKLRLGDIKSKKDFSSKFYKKLSKYNFDVIYANSVQSISVGIAIKEKLGVKLIAHIHELPTVINILQPDFIEKKDDIDLFLSPSKLVSQKLTEEFSVDSTKISTVYEFIEKEKHTQTSERKTDVFKIGAAGTFHWRKGNDVFLQVARHLLNHYPELKVEFLWVGALPEQERIIVEQDIIKLGLTEVVRFTGLVEKPTEYFKDLDLFVLTSREDPFPLVCIEVGVCGIPIICFEDATGTEEVVRKTGNFVVPYLNIEQMAEKIHFYYNNPEIAKIHGKNNKKEFSEFTSEKICPLIFEAIEKI